MSKKVVTTDNCRKGAPATAPAALAPAAAPSDGEKIALTRKLGVTELRAITELVAVGPLASAVTLTQFAKITMTRQSGEGLVSNSECIGALRDAGKRACEGNLRDAEAMLVAQAMTLNTIFNVLAQRGALNIGERLSAVEAYLRLALKAQNQSRMTFETLANIKNPPTIFAKQANIAHQQQVNNGVASTAAAVPPAPLARTEEIKPLKTQLLEAGDGERMDTGATGPASRVDPHLAAVGEVNRPANAGGESEVGDARRQGRAMEAGARNAPRSAERIE